MRFGFECDSVAFELPRYPRRGTQGRSRSDAIYSTATLWRGLASTFAWTAWLLSVHALCENGSGYQSSSE